MPKKKKIVQDKSETPNTGGSFKLKAAKGNRTRRSTANQKPRKTVATKGASAIRASLPSEPAGSTEPSDDAVRLRAYYISERRRRFALPGDAESDWIEAKRQLLFETGHH